MIKQKYLIVGHMWWCSLVVGKGTRELRLWVQILVTLENIYFLIFIHAANIYFNMQKNDTGHLCVDIDDGLRIP